MFTPGCVPVTGTKHGARGPVTRGRHGGAAHSRSRAAPCPPPAPPASWKAPLPMDTGDTAWVLTSAALVLLMTPGLALFYGGMVRAKSVLNMMMMSFGAMALIGVLWVLYGFSVAFGNDVGGGLLGDPFEYFGLNGLLGADHLVGTLPAMAFVGLPVRLRHHRRRPDLRGHRRPRQVRRLDGLRRGLGDDRLLPRRALGVRLRRRRLRGRRLDRRAGASSTSPAAPRSTSTPVPPASPSPSSSASAAGSAASRCARTTCRWSCSAPGCCGSAGSASTPGRPPPPTAPPRSPGSTPSSRPSAAILGWLLTEKVRDGHADLPRRGLRRRRRPRRHHPGLLRAEPGQLDRRRRHRRRRCAPWRWA